jgi:hypothetical protein
MPSSAAAESDPVHGYWMVPAALVAVALVLFAR